MKAPLPKWRLNRVVEYVDTRLDERVTLAEMAGVAGLTRMHFAAQFRRATGVSPHAYLLQRRVERAKELLRDTTRPLADIALSVGFWHAAALHYGVQALRWRNAASLASEYCLIG